MSYYDIMVAAVPTANRDAYLAHADEMAKVFKEYGAEKLVDCWGDEVPPGEVTSLPMAVQCKEDETVVVGWIQWASKEAHDTGWEQVMKDPRMAPDAGKMPFDGKRMIFGSFSKIAEF
ncbi:DUF1428 domain-containing protein [Halovulum sp. GXIMD14794]